MATITSPAPTYTSRYAIYFEDGRWLIGILAALLYLVLALALDVAGHVPDLSLLLPVTLGAIVLATLMSYSRFDGFFALSHSMFTGLAWILYQMSGMVSSKEIESFLHFGIPATQAKVYFVLYRLLTWIDAAFGNAASNDNYVFIFEICFLVWWLTYLGVWSILRYGHTWRAIVPAGLVLVINTYYAPNSTLGFLVVFTLLALTLLVRTNLAEQQMRWRDESIYFSQDIVFDFVRDGLIYSVLVLALAWIAPSLGRSGQVRDFLRPLNDQWTRTTEQVSQLYSGLNRRQVEGGSAFGRTLSLGGRREVGSGPVFQVATPIGRYWRAVVFDTFTGRQWQNTAQEEVEFDANAALPFGNWNLRTPITQTVTLLAATGNVIFAAPDVRQVNVPVTTLVRASAGTDSAAVQNPEVILPPNELTYLRAQEALEAGDSYTVVSQYTVVTERALESARVDYATPITTTYLQLPETISQRVTELAASLTLSSTSVYAKAKAIESYLRTIPYNDAIEAPPPDVDPVEYFLFDIQQGYCDYYATAMAVMLRSVGIPTRTASGYAEGTYDEESGLYFVTEQDAHTWVEVYFPDYGWVEFEPTAGESALNRPTGSEGEGGPEGTPTASAAGGAQPSAEPTFDPLNPGDTNSGENQTGGENANNFAGLPLWLWAILTPLLLIVGVWGLRRSQAFGPTAFTPELSPIIYERMQRWAERLGLRPLDSDTPYEQATRMST
ncbi:MAG: DUF3488 and transglutaminase-like domain-containing protein, partial [Chloroflexota bacterium]|nr:DUF3488 and transglutaminase-like domain-containing protein [Chloroflexota bacterium]